MKDKENMGCMSILGITLYIFFVFPVTSILFRGWVFARVWSWFVHPLGVPVIHVAHAVGLMSIVSFVRPFRVDTETTKWIREQLGINREFTPWENVAFLTVWGYGGILISYLFASIVHHYM